MVQRIDHFAENIDGDFSFLSNFYVEEDGMSLEHYYQAAKTDDSEWVARICLADTPAEAKQLGREAPLRPTWDAEKIPVMRSLILRKFSQEELGVWLMETGDAELVEGNNWGDTFWGEVNGRGENWLGKLLMEMRDVLNTALEIATSEW